MPPVFFMACDLWGDPGASMASHSPTAGSGGGDPARPGRPFPPRRAGAGMIRHSAPPPPPLPPRRGRCADPGASHPSAAAATSGDPVTSRASPFRHGWRRWWMVQRVQGVPSAMAAGAGDRVGRACLWWYSVLSTHYIGMWFYRPVTTIGRVIRPDFCVNENLQNFFRVNDNLQKFFMGDLCVNANQH